MILGIPHKAAGWAAQPTAAQENWRGERSSLEFKTGCMVHEVGEGDQKVDL